MPERATHSPQPVQVPDLGELFAAFLKVSLIGFGGVLPWARRMIVEDRKWMGAAEFNEVFSLCQFLPGPNIVNFAVVFGARLHGRRGALVSALGLLVPPILVMSILGALYARYGDLAALQRALAGLGAAAAGLIVATAVNMARPLFRRSAWRGPLVVAIVFVAIGILQVPLWWGLLALVPLSIALAWRWP